MWVSKIFQRNGKESNIKQNNNKLQIQKYENEISNLKRQLDIEHKKWKQVDAELESKHLELTKVQDSLKLYEQKSDCSSNTIAQIKKLKDENALLKEKIHQLTNNEQMVVTGLEYKRKIHQNSDGNTISTGKLLQQSKKQNFNAQTNIQHENMLVSVKNTNLEIKQPEIQIKEKNKKIQKLNISHSNCEKKIERILQTLKEEVQKRNNEIEQQKSTIFLLNHALENMTNHAKDLMANESMHQKTYTNKETIKNLQYQLHFSETTVAKLQTLVKIQAARIKTIMDLQSQKTNRSEKLRQDHLNAKKDVQDRISISSCSQCINCADLKKLEDLQIENVKIWCKFEKQVDEILFLRKNHQISEKNNKQIIVDLQTEIEALRQDKHTLESSADEVIELLNKSNQELKAKLDKISR